MKNKSYCDYFDRYYDMSQDFNGNLSSSVHFTEFSLVNKKKMMLM